MKPLLLALGLLIPQVAYALPEGTWDCRQRQGQLNQGGRVGWNIEFRFRLILTRDGSFLVQRLRNGVARDLRAMGQAEQRAGGRIFLYGDHVRSGGGDGGLFAMHLDRDGADLFFKEDHRPGPGKPVQRSEILCKPVL